MADAQDKGIRVPGPDNPKPESRSGRNHLLVIAIDEYVHCPKLHNCVRDARALVDVLTEKYRFEPGDVTTLYNEEATRPRLHATLKALRSTIRPEDNFILYFSGHGETEDNLGYWVPVDAHPEREWEFFSTDEIRRRLEAIHSFHTFVVVDACFSGMLFATYKSVKAGYEHRRSRLGLAASHSRERALDGTAGENSPFSTMLLKILQESRDNLGVQLLATEVTDAVLAATEGRQTPVFKPLNIRGDDAGQFVFRLKREAPNSHTTEPIAPQTGSFADPRDGNLYRTVKIGDLTWMAENLNFDVGEGTWFYADQPGNGKKYGRLYTWEAAWKACPPGWRLPTDKEWRSMARLFGGCADDADDEVKAAFEALTEGGYSGLQIRFGGQRYYDGSFVNLESYAYFWTGTQYAVNKNWIYAFNRADREMQRYGVLNVQLGVSCRCVQD